MTYISNEVDEHVCKCERKCVWRGLLETWFEGCNTITVTEETDISQQVQWNLRVLEKKRKRNILCTIIYLFMGNTGIEIIFMRKKKSTDRNQSGTMNTHQNVKHDHIFCKNNQIVKNMHYWSETFYDYRSETFYDHLIHIYFSRW